LGVFSAEAGLAIPQLWDASLTDSRVRSINGVVASDAQIRLCAGKLGRHRHSEQFAETANVDGTLSMLTELAFE